MNGMITRREDFDLEEILPKLKAYSPTGVVMATTCKEREVLPGDGYKVALLDLGAKKKLLATHCIREVVKLPFILLTQKQRIFLRQILMALCFQTVLETRRSVQRSLRRSKKLYDSNVPNFCNLSWPSADGTGKWS
mgnify:CR=1 FL=1